MNYEMISGELLEQRCKSGEFYSKDEDDDLQACSIREAAIESLAGQFEGNPDVFISDFVHPWRVVFVDIEMEGFCQELIDALVCWVNSDAENHAIRCLLYDGKVERGNFLVSKQFVFFEEPFKEFDWLRL